MFRLGLAAYLAQFADLSLVREVDSGIIALGVIREVLARAGNAPVVVLLSLELGGSEVAGLNLCRQLRSQLPTLPFVLLSHQLEPAFLATAYQTGATGYCEKRRAVTNLAAAIRQVAAGQTYWAEGMQAIAGAMPPRPTPSSPILANQTTLAVLRRNLRLAGVQQIETAIAQLEAQLRYPQLSLLDELVLTGRRRELLTARWLVNRLFANAAEPAELPLTQASRSSQRSSLNPPVSFPTVAPTIRPIESPRQTIAPLASATIATSVPAVDSVASRSLQAVLMDATSAKLQSSLHNLTETPLEIDILQIDKKRELLYLILRKLEVVLDDLRFSQVAPTQLATRRADILRDLWQQTITDFLGRYSTLPTHEGDVPVVDVLLPEGDRIEADILSKIPLVPELLTHLLYQAPLKVDDATYAPGNVEALTRAEVILQHLTIQIANAVMQPLLNRFGNIESIKQNFFDQRLLSTREVERFRNNLSWKYRVEKYFKEPTAIFESRYNLLVLREAGIAKTSIYAPRNYELEQLAGIPLAVTFALEARDAIAPRLRATISFIGSGVVYILTEVIGRGIGLVGRGVIKGIGNTFQETRFNRINRDNRRWR